MIKVKEYLDKNYFSTEKSESSLKNNGHYSVFGAWEFPKGIRESESARIREHMKADPSLSSWIPKDQMILMCNNETLRLIMIILGKSVGYYGYLQSYEHIPRGNPDVNGLYARSTDEEIINYLDGFYRKINRDKIRDSKISSILD